MSQEAVQAEAVSDRERDRSIFQVGKIPLDNRTSFVQSDIADNTPWRLVAEIADRLGVNERWAQRLVKDMDIEPRMRVVGNSEIAEYPPHTEAILREERQWRETFFSLPPRLSAGRMAEVLGRSEGWVRKNLLSLEAKSYPGDRVGAHSYAKGQLHKLRQLSLETPFDDGWYTASGLVEATGYDREWILARLAEVGFEPEDRRSALTGRVLPYFPPEAVGVLVSARQELPKAGGDWLTTQAMMVLSGKSWGWLSRRLFSHIDDSELRLDDNGVKRRHFPPAVFESVIMEAKSLENFPEATAEDLSLRDLARAVGHTSMWTRERLNSLGVEPESRRDKRGRVRHYFQSSLIEVLRQNSDASLEVQRMSPEIIPELFAYGSLKSQVQATNQLLHILKTFGGEADKNQLSELNTNLAALRTKSRQAYREYYNKLLRVNSWPA